MSHDWKFFSRDLPMGSDFERKSASRMGWVPVMINEAKEVIPVEYHGSAHIASLSISDGIISIAPGVKSLAKGEIVNVLHL